MSRRRSSHHRATAPWVRRRRRVYLIVTFVAILLAVPIGWRLHLRTELQRELSELRAKGLPTTVSELVDWTRREPIDGESEAAYEAVFRSYHEMDPTDLGQLPKLSGDTVSLLQVPFSVDVRAVLEKRVAGNEEMLAHLLDASRYPRYDTVKALDVEHAYQTQSLSLPMEVLFAQICLTAERGEGDAALDLVMAGIRISRACRATPLLHVFNEAISRERQMLSAVYPVAVRAEISDEKLAEFLALAREDTWREDLTDAMTGTLCIQLAWLNEGEHGPMELLEEILGSRQQMAIDLIRVVEAVPDYAELPWQEREAYASAHKLPPYTHYFFWEQSPSDFVSAEAIAVLRYRKARGTLPDSFDELVPEYLSSTPRDGKTGAPLQLEQDASSFTIYRAGEDGTVEGERTQQKTVFQMSFDAS